MRPPLGHHGEQVETLRRAAAQIRNDRGGVVSRNTRDGRRWLPVADWLEQIAEDEPFLTAQVRDRALAVARAYLEEG